MSVQELESKVQLLSEPDLKAFKEWFEEYLADEWDRQIERDILAGRLDKLGSEAIAHVEADRCTSLGSTRQRSNFWMPEAVRSQMARSPN